MPLKKLERIDIIRMSITVFRQKGYYRTNMSDLATFCGLTKGAFYHHFASKEDVMRHCLETTSSWFKENIFSIAYQETIPDQDKLKQLLQSYLQTFLHEKGGCFMANTILETTQVEDTFKEIMVDFFDSWEKALIAIFKSNYSTSIAKQKSVQLIAELEGAIILMLLREDPKYLKNVINKSIRTF